MAALTADADESAGKQLGFANPFLYAHAGTSIFHDIVSGTNNLFGGRRYTAGPGYDLATGLGSIRRGRIRVGARHLDAAGRSRSTRRALDLDRPGRRPPPLYGHRVTFRGRLIDTTTGEAVANAQVLVTTTVDTYRVRTNAGGAWSVSRSKAIGSDMSWHAVYLGSEVNAPATSPSRKLLVQPHLGLSIHLPFRNGHYIAAAGKPFSAFGRSRPVMAGAVVMLQARRGGGPWRDVGPNPVVGGGRYQHDGVRLQRGQAVRCGGPTSAARSGAGSRPTRAPSRWWPRSLRAITVRAAAPADYDRIAPLVDAWWGGRAMIDMLPRLFFVHFAETAFVAEDGDELAGFLAGFLSQSRPDEAYIHFAGVSPDHRGRGVGRLLYERFFAVAREHSRTSFAASRRRSTSAPSLSTARWGSRSTGSPRTTTAAAGTGCSCRSGWREWTGSDPVYSSFPLDRGGGFEEMSSATRFTPGISLMMRLEIRSSTS